MSGGYAMALVGAQFGSEGKGVIAGALADSFRGAIRVGGPNAGHSLYKDGRLFKMRSVPCAWVNPDAVLMIGAGAVVNPHVLMDEAIAIGNMTGADFRVIIDPQAVLVRPEDEHYEMAVLRDKIGSTAEGVGQARIAKIAREGLARLAKDYPWPAWVEIGDVASLAADLMDVGGRIMLEGTQGAGLSLHHGIYPYVTSTDTNASGIAAEAGIAPSKVKCTHLVVRTFPIRVAGNSGPMGGQELSWDDLTERFQIDAPEQTTVTKKVRRIAEYDEAQVDRAVMLNNPCGIWVTFGDYLDPSIRGKRWVGESESILQFVERLRDRYYAPVLGVTTGPGRYSNGNSDWMIAQLDDECQHGERYRVNQVDPVVVTGNGFVR